MPREVLFLKKTENAEVAFTADRVKKREDFIAVRDKRRGLLPALEGFSLDMLSFGVKK